jgi:hypothetical protein
LLCAVSVLVVGVSASPAFAQPQGKTLVAVVRGNVLFIDCVSGNFLSISKDKYVEQTGREPTPGLQSTTALPPQVLEALTSQTNPKPSDRPIREDAPDVCADYTVVTSLIDRARRETNVTGPGFTTSPANPPVSTPGTELLVCASPPCF